VTVMSLVRPERWHPQGPDPLVPQSPRSGRISTILGFSGDQPPKPRVESRAVQVLLSLPGVGPPAFQVRDSCLLLQEAGRSLFKFPAGNGWLSD
jgi:hypothetical protein